MVEKGFTSELALKIRKEIEKAVINQSSLTNYAIVCLLSGGHMLIEGVPGLAKTLWVKALSMTLNTEFKRVQFTSDLMPSDILGAKIYQMEQGAFALKKGPLFTNLFLADEINRTPPKTQSALLQVMEERAITIDGETTNLHEPFMVVATQNPIEYEGTYPLPEALTDRFMMKLLLTYPGVAAEKAILNMYNSGFSSARLDSSLISPVASAEDISCAKEEVTAVTVEDSILNYIISIIETTRRVNAVAIGASPRGSIALLTCSKAYAAIQGRDFVVPDDVKELALPILRHRIILKSQAEIDGLKTDKVIENILSQVKVPR